MKIYAREIIREPTTADEGRQEQLSVCERKDLLQAKFDTHIEIEQHFAYLVWAKTPNPIARIRWKVL